MCVSDLWFEGSEVRREVVDIHHRQETYSVKEPPTIGPNARPNWPSPMFTPRNCACARGGRMAAMIVKAPLAIPEEPTPAMALPTMNMADDWAAPHNREPSSKTTKKTRKDHWILFMLVMHQVKL